MQAWLTALMHDTAFWGVVWAFIVGFIFMKGGIVQQLLTALGGVLERWAQKRLPANEYAVLKNLAEDFCRAVWQEGSAYGWNDEKKKQSAVDSLKAAAANHGIDLGKWGDLLGPIVEAAWANLKPTLPPVLQSTANPPALGDYPPGIPSSALTASAPTGDAATSA